MPGPAPPSSLSQRNFAIRVGCSRQYIGQLVAKGKLPVNEDKSIPVPAGLEAFAVLKRTSQMPPTLDDTTPQHEEVAALSVDLRHAQLEERTQRARSVEIKNQERLGLLVPVDEVRADVRAICESVRNALLALGSRVALPIEAVCASGRGLRAHEIQKIIEDEVNLILQALHTSRFGAEDGRAVDAA